jgi:hypothetical protein
LAQQKPKSGEFLERHDIYLYCKGTIESASDRYIQIDDDTIRLLESQMSNNKGMEEAGMLLISHVTNHDTFEGSGHASLGTGRPLPGLVASLYVTAHLPERPLAS